MGVFRCPQRSTLRHGLLARATVGGADRGKRGPGENAPEGNLLSPPLKYVMHIWLLRAQLQLVGWLTPSIHLLSVMGVFRWNGTQGPLQDPLSGKRMGDPLS